MMGSLLSHIGAAPCATIKFGGVFTRPILDRIAGKARYAGIEPDGGD
ncbi:MAG: hypothetical protein U0X75_00760 [Acidobacteriota bacterium]